MYNTVTLTKSMMQSLLSLQNTTSMMDITANRLSTGKRVNSALDDPINFFKSQTHMQRASDLQVLKDGMNEAIATIKAANEGIEGIMDLIASAKSLAQAAAATTDAAEVASYKTQYDAILGQIDDLATDSGYGGVNLLADGDALTVNFNEDGTSSVELTGTDVSGAGVLALTDATDWTAVGGIETDIAALDAAKTTLRSLSKTLANNLNLITTRQEFTANLIATLQGGAADLVNADMNEESVKITTLQTQQQFAISSLGIASTASQSVLSLLQ
jgi:flagellin